MTIGVLVSGLYDEYTRGICEGIRYIAMQDDINMVIIPGNYLQFDLHYAYANVTGYQYNSSFFYGEKAGFDGLIIEMGSVGMFASEEFKRDFTAHFQHIPHVYISHKEEGFCNVFIDNKVGMRDALEHLYSQGNRKYAMIGGPVENVDAKIRKETFFEFLEEHGLSHPDCCYQDGDFVLDCSPQINRLLDDNPDVEAVVCANDVLARFACNCLHKRGRIAGRDVSVLGYDDSADACNKPSLSTVRTDFSQLGIESYKALLRVINGEKIDEISVPTKFIKRDSFVEKNKPALSDISITDLYNFDSITKKNVSHIHTADLDEIKKKFADLAVRFVDIESYVDKEDEVLLYLDNFSTEIGRLNYLKYIDADLCRQYLRQRYELQMEKGLSPKASILLSKIYMRLYYNMSTALHYYYESGVTSTLTKQSTQYLRQDVFSFEHGDDSNFAYILEKADTFGVKNAFIYLYEEPKFMFHNEDFQIPEYLLLKAVMTDKKVTVLSSANQRTHLSHILDNDYITLTSDKPMMLFPLYCSEQMYGILVCDYNFDNFATSGMFVAQLSSAVKMLATLRANDTLLSEYEDTLQVLKSNNIELDKLSKSDYLTGLMNRRGFRAKTEELLAECHRNNKAMMLVYVDMNNLKIINDKFGHENGDYALQQTARILKETIKDIGIAGRIGGDEFACALPCDGQLSEKAFISKLYQKFDIFNENSDKSYVVGVCAGACVIACSDHITLERALEIADERLYQEKTTRSKNIFKVSAPAS